MALAVVVTTASVVLLLVLGSGDGAPALSNRGDGSSGVAPEGAALQAGPRPAPALQGSPERLSVDGAALRLTGTLVARPQTEPPVRFLTAWIEPTTEPSVIDDDGSFSIGWSQPVALPAALHVKLSDGREMTAALSAPERAGNLVSYGELVLDVRYRVPIHLMLEDRVRKALAATAYDVLWLRLYDAGLPHKMLVTPVDETRIPIASTAAEYRVELRSRALMMPLELTVTAVEEKRRPEAYAKLKAFAFGYVQLHGETWEVEVRASSLVGGVVEVAGPPLGIQLRGRVGVEAQSRPIGATPSSNGRFLIDVGAAGEATLWVSGRPEQRTVIRGGTLDAVLRVDTESGPNALVVWPDGSPVERFRLQLAMPAGVSDRDAGLRTYDDGRIALWHVLMAGQPWYVTTEQGVFQAVVEQNAEGSPGILRLDTPCDGSLTVEVGEAIEAKRYGSLWLTLIEHPPDHWGTRFTILGGTNDDGTMRAENILPGTYKYQLRDDYDQRYEGVVTIDGPTVLRIGK